MDAVTIEQIRTTEAKRNNSHLEVGTKPNVYIAQNAPNYMRKLKFTAKTLENKLVIDALCAVSNLDKSPISKDSYFVVGGIATQSYLPAAYRRGTADIDLSITKPLSRREAEEFAKPAIQYLLDNKYNIEKSEDSDFYLKKGHNAYELYFNDGKDGAVIEFSRRGIESIRRIEKMLSRELEHTKLKAVPGKDLLYRVKCPEDIVLPKLVRCVGTLARNESLMKKHVGGKFKSITEKEAMAYLKGLKELREVAMIHAGDPSRSEELRLVADIYDTRALTTFAGFNEAYIRESSKDWRMLTAPSKERDALVEFLVPNLIERYDTDQPNLFETEQ